jgi:hypothetical protein
VTNLNQDLTEESVDAGGEDGYRIGVKEGDRPESESTVARRAHGGATDKSQCDDEPDQHGNAPSDGSKVNLLSKHGPKF